MDVLIVLCLCTNGAYVLGGPFTFSSFCWSFLSTTGMKNVLPLCLINSEGARKDFPLVLLPFDFLFSTRDSLSVETPRLAGEVGGTDAWCGDLLSGKIVDGQAM